MDVADSLRLALADRYTIERELGQGGMATVYLGEDLRHHRKVALKVLHPEIAATLGAGRFAREIEAAAPLQHPNILPLLDSGEPRGDWATDACTALRAERPCLASGEGDAVTPAPLRGTGAVERRHIRGAFI